MENRYPLFAGGRILKKEALWDLRDYAYGGWQLYYADYTDGILKGCNVRVEGMNLVIGKGILKYRNFIYFLQEEATVPYAAENRPMILKAAFEEKLGNPDYMAYAVQFFLDDNPERQENQIELCRFHLREGAVLRDTYKDFRDMGTEYDTINLLHATMAGSGYVRMHPLFLIQFAEEMCGRKENEPADIAFCYEVLNYAGEVNLRLVRAYLQDKGIGLEKQIWSEEEIFWKMEDILERGSSKEYCSERKKVIYVE